MSSYVEEALIEGEQILHFGRLSLWQQPFMMGAGILLAPLGIGLLLLLSVYVKYKTTELAITNKRVIAKFGFVSRRTVEISIAKVESIQVDQSVLGRMFDYGTLVVAGAGDPQAPIVGISNPMAFRKAFLEAQDVARQDGPDGDSRLKAV